jgi:hypothetical protein
MAVLMLTMVAACRGGALYGTGTACDERTPCRAPLVCVVDRCQGTDGAVADTAGGFDRDIADTGGSADSVVPDMAGRTDHNADATGDSGEEVPDAADDADANGRVDVATETHVDVGVDAADDGPSGDGPTGSDAEPPPPQQPPVVLVFATADNGRLWLIQGPVSSLLDPVINHAPAMDVSEQFGSIGPLDDVEAQGVGHDVDVLAQLGTTIYLASARGPDRLPWRKVADDVLAMGLADRGGQLWACLVDTSGHLRLATLLGTGSWQDQGDVMGEATGSGDAPQTLRKVDCAGVGSDLEILALDESGSAWQATKGGAAWNPFARFAPAGALVFQDVDVGESFGELHVLLSTRSEQFHAARASDGTWYGLGDVERSVGDPSGEVLAGAMTVVGSEIEWLQVNSYGEIWLSSRMRIDPYPYQLLVPFAPDGHRFVTVAAATGQ